MCSPTILVWMLLGTVSYFSRDMLYCARPLVMPRSVDTYWNISESGTLALISCSTHRARQSIAHCMLIVTRGLCQGGARTTRAHDEAHLQQNTLALISCGTQGGASSAVYCSMQAQCCCAFAQTASGRQLTGAS